MLKEATSKNEQKVEELQKMIAALRDGKEKTKKERTVSQIGDETE